MPTGNWRCQLTDERQLLDRRAHVLTCLSIRPGYRDRRIFRALRSLHHAGDGRRRGNERVGAVGLRSRRRVGPPRRRRSVCLRPRERRLHDRGLRPAQRPTRSRLRFRVSLQGVRRVRVHPVVRGPCLWRRRMRRIVRHVHGRQIVQRVWELRARAERRRRLWRLRQLERIERIERLWSAASVFVHDERELVLRRRTVLQRQLLRRERDVSRVPSEHDARVLHQGQPVLQRPLRHVVRELRLGVQAQDRRVHEQQPVLQRQLQAGQLSLSGPASATMTRRKRARYVR